jgi:RimJ/RimL family protein N-acetyltransferase
MIDSECVIDPGIGFPDRIETERLVLRRWTEEEWPRVLSVWSDPEIWRSLEGTREFNESFVRTRFEHHVENWELDGFGLLTAIDRATGDTAGWIGPARPDFVKGLEREVEIGWSLRRAYRGRGLATEGARASIDAVFAHLPVERAIALISPANEQSIAVAERLGMTYRNDVRHMRTGQPLRVYELAA